MLTIITSICLSVLISTTITVIWLRHYLREIDKVFDESLKEHREGVTKVTIDTINNWLGSRYK